MSFRQDRRRHADDEMETDAKRRRAPESQSELERRVVDLIMHIGEKPGQTSLESNLEKLVTLLEGELERIGQRIIETIIECAKNLPDKLTIYSTLVGLLNAKNYNFGGEIVEKLVADLQQTLESEKHRHAANLVTFICDLANCKVLSLTSVVEFLEGLLEAASEDGVPQVRSDWFIYAVLRSLPWIGVELKEKKTEELENLLGGVDAYMQQRSRTHIRILQVWTGSTHEQEEYLDCLHEQVKLLAGAEWKEKHIARMYIAFDAVLTDALSHNLPTLAPPAHTAASAYPLPHVVFRLFDYADCPEDGPVLPGAHSIERHLIDEELGWIIDLNEMNRKDCAEALLNYTHRAAVPLPYVVLETVFSRLFSLPDSPQPRLFYGALLIELCRLQPNTFPQVLAQAAELLYDRAHEMQPACLDRFVDWFSYHLSNFQYRWSWQDWNDCLEADALDNKFILAKEVLEKCMRFSYYERILEILPESHKRLQPAKPDVIYPMEDENHEEFERARHFQALFQEKLAADAMIEELRVEEQTGEGPEFDSRSFAVFFAVLLKLASKSFSHNFAALTRYHKTLKHVVANSPVMQQTLLSTLYGCWRNNTQMMLILIDKLLKMQILDCSIVVAWIFDGEEAQQEHSRQWLWEMLNNSLEKLGKHVAKCKKDLETLKAAKQRKEKARKEKEDAKGEANEEQMEEGDDEAAAAEMDGELLTKEAEVEALADAQKRIFLDVLMKFATALTARLQEQGDGAEKSLWYTFVQGRMRHVFLAHEPVIREFAGELEQQLVAKADLDKRAIQVFAEFAALRA